MAVVGAICLKMIRPKERKYEEMRKLLEDRPHR